MSTLGTLLLAIFLVLLVWLLVAEGISHVLFGAEFLVAGGSNSLSDSQDLLVGSWPIWIALPVLGWMFRKRLRQHCSSAAKWTTRHVRYVSWKESPRHWVPSLLAGRKRDRLHAEAAAALEAQRARAEEERKAVRERAAQRERHRRANLGLRSSIKSRIPKDADDFESVCAEWVVKCGTDAKRTDKGRDSGLDVKGANFAGQCKFHPSNKVGAPDVQQLAGAAEQARKRQKVFFHYGPGYTPAAIEAARSLGVELWEMDVDQHTFRKVD